MQKSLLRILASSKTENNLKVAQMVKNLSAMRETWVRSLGWDDPLEEDIATHSSILAWRTPMDRGALTGYSPSGCSTSQTLLSD